MTHRIRYTVHEIGPDDLPKVPDPETFEPRAATDQQLADMNIFRTPDPGHYSCALQHRRDDDLLIETGEEKWEPHGIEIPGTIVTEGPRRFKELPADVRGRVLQARVIRSTIVGETAFSIGQANIDEQAAAIAENVGTVDGAALVDLSSPDAHVEEARRLAAIPDSGVELALIQMAAVDPEAHVIEATDIEPHRWAGERRW